MDWAAVQKVSLKLFEMGRVFDLKKFKFGKLFRA
jgi:hypothetical protein